MNSPFIFQPIHQDDEDNEEGDGNSAEIGRGDAVRRHL